MPLLEIALKDYLTEKLGSGLKLTLTNNRRSMFSMKQNRWGSIDLRIARYFALAEKPVIDDLVGYLKGETKRLPQSVRHFAELQPPDIVATKNAKKRAEPAGQFFNLRPLADELNKLYFGGNLDFSITWGRQGKGKRRAKSRAIQLGSYNPDANQITIHPVLDASFVLQEYLELIIYHEILHKLQAKDTPKGVRPKLCHDKDFKIAEQRFANYAIAKEWGDKNFSRLLKARNA